MSNNFRIEGFLIEKILVSRNLLIIRIRNYNSFRIFDYSIFDSTPMVKQMMKKFPIIPEEI
jgi:hypothetical protein